jgi:hypothetical protein
MSDDKIQPINDPKEMPSGLSDEEQLAYWETHGLTEEYLQKTEEVPEEERPRTRTSPISVRFDAHTLSRLKSLAEKRGVGYQTLLKEFVTERLYEEEKREGITSVESAKVHEESTVAYWARLATLAEEALTWEGIREVSAERVTKPESSINHEDLDKAALRSSFYAALESNLTDLASAAWENYNWLQRKAASSSKQTPDREQRN